MNSFKTVFLPIVLTTLWISISEFIRNTFLIHDHWVNHYTSLGQVFPEQPANGVVWGIWSLCFAVIIFIISKKFNFLQTALLSWFIGFVLMWLVIGNMGVMPFGILPLAIPLSLLETFFASYIVHRLKS
ncbi:MAG: hypothetical protein H6607_11115 [Flavobacteriales bacterium]|nr:hypothetical protein [Flavobacteriales bacterium]